MAQCRVLDRIIKGTATGALEWANSLPVRGRYSLQFQDDQGALIALVGMQMSETTGDIHFTIADERVEGHSMLFFDTGHPAISRFLRWRLLVLFDIVSGEMEF